jgi:hypothetical protein
MDGKMSREALAWAYANPIASKLDDDVECGSLRHQLVTAFLSGYDASQNIRPTKDDIADYSITIEYLTDKLKQLESQLLAQKTLTEVTVEYLEEKLKKAEGVIEFYSDGDGDVLDWDRVNNPSCIQDRGKRARQYLSDKDGKDT